MKTARKVPNLVGKLRYLCRGDQFPEHKAELLRVANRLLITIEALNTPVSGYENLLAYRQAAAVVKRITGEVWAGEVRK